MQNVVNGVAANRYLFHDHLGSVIAATNENGAVLEGGGFNAFGERRTNGSATGITTTGLASTTRGYTGHEMLDDGLDVIHMNGRIYDPTLGRFLQPDPVIQSPHNPQNWNAYSYVFNNPYRYTDPTGMIGQEERQWLSTAVALAVSWFAPQVGYALYGTAAAANAVTVALIAAGGAISGGIVGGSQGALMGAFTSVLGMAGGNFATNTFFSVVSSRLQGSDYSSALMGVLRSMAINFVIQTAVAATKSRMTGGKNANGADSEAMAVVTGFESTGSGEGASRQAIDQNDPKVIAANQRLDQAKKVKGARIMAGGMGQNEARLAAAGRYVPDGYTTGREANWFVVKLSDETFGYTSPNVGAPNQVSVGVFKADHIMSLKFGDLTVVAIDSIGHNHLWGDLNFSGYDYRLVNGRTSSHRGGTVWLWNEKGEAWSLPSDRSIRSFAIPRTIEGIRNTEYDIPISW